MKIKNVSYIALMTALVLGLASGVPRAGAQEKESRGQLSAKDFKFVTTASQAGMKEVMLGQLAAKNGTDPSVRTFGQQMVNDHQKANQELAQLVTQKGATVSSSPSKEDNKELEHLEGLSGAAFDKAYIKEMVSDHKMVVKEFQTAADKSDDADLKSWAAKTLPTLQDHLRMAQSAETMVNGTKAQASASQP